MRLLKALLVRTMLAAALAGAAACGSSPTAPATPPGLAPPSVPLVTSQHVHLPGDDIQFTWVGQASSYQLEIGTATGASDALVVSTTASNYTWTAAKPGLYYVRVRSKNGSDTSSPSIETVVQSIDLRDVIDALIFGDGPFGDITQKVNTFSYVSWPDSQSVRVLISPEVSASNRTGAQKFLDDFASLTGGAVTGFIEISSDTMKTVTTSALAQGTVAVRILSPWCPTGAIGCTTYLPAGGSPTRALITIDAVTENDAVIQHELGHAFGLSHVRLPSAAILPSPLMNPINFPVPSLTETELEALRVVRQAGMKGGDLRSAFLAKGLVNP